MATSIANLINDVCSHLDRNVRDRLIGQLEGDGCFDEKDLKNLSLQELLQRFKFPLIPAKKLKERGLLQETHIAPAEYFGSMVVREEGDPMFDFVASLALPGIRDQFERARSTSEFVISLPGDVYWLGDESTFSIQVFVRRAYGELKEARRECFAAGSYSTTLITGTPGIGKSHLAALMVAELLIEGKVVFLEFQSGFFGGSSEFFRLRLGKDGRAVVENFIHVKDGVEALRKESKTAAYIVDGCVPSYGHRCFLKLIFGSARKEFFRLSNKDPTWLVLYMPLFELEELVKCAQSVSRFSKLKESKIREWFYLAGGIPRTVLYRQVVGNMGPTIQEWILDLRRSMVSPSFRMDVPSDGFLEGSDKIFHWAIPDTKHLSTGSGSGLKSHLRRYTKKYMRFASPQVAAVLCITIGNLDAMEVAKFCVSSNLHMEHAAWFEDMAHIMLAAGGRFECRLIQEEASFTL
ncbi:hypothetical protein KC19_5G152600 [Ceratodon purpureus]|uniref:Uncharacterized protein n=1 Tax=Ceratodon purpureus TaxID=3225 RepID=A0A8T0I369_CERPU|nr:hypothetical protein KC19_5G152600 [Ceratodon purpureus]